MSAGSVGMPLPGGSGGPGGPGSAGAGTPPRILAMDTSTEVLALALLGPDGVRTHTAPGGAQASATLLPQAWALLRQAGLVPAQLQAVAFGSGPGAFTGLRTSCAVAQGLGLGIGCPVLPIDSLLLVADDARAAAGPAAELPCDIEVAMDARMDEVYAARYRWVAPGVAAAAQPAVAGWQVLRAPALLTLPALRSAWQHDPPPWVAGSALVAFGERLPVPPGARRTPGEASRAHALARLAQAAWQSGNRLDAAQALPLYLRDKVALTSEERAVAKALAAGTPGAAA